MNDFDVYKHGGKHQVQIVDDDFEFHRMGNRMPFISIFRKVVI